MRIPRDVATYLERLKTACKLQQTYDEQKSDIEFAVMTPETAAEREKLLAGEIKYSDLSLNTLMWLGMEGLNQKRKRPIDFSELPRLLDLETWLPQDAMLILAGVDPSATLMKWSYENFMGAQIHKPVISHAHWFTSTSDLYDYPTEKDAEFSPSGLKRMIKEVEQTSLSTTEVQSLVVHLRELLADVEKWQQDETSKFKRTMLDLRAEMVGILKTRWDSGDHDATLRRSPTFFVQWAESRGFEIEWASWARESGYIDTAPPITAPPYFDADAEDYPKLLHIAVRAWEHATKGTQGTAKQRITVFLQERYPELSGGERDAIAMIGNWQKAGGRPRKGG